MSTAEKIFQKAQTLPEPAQDKLLQIAEEMASQYLEHEGCAIAGGLTPDLDFLSQ